MSATVVSSGTTSSGNGIAGDDTIVVSLGGTLLSASIISSGNEDLYGSDQGTEVYDGGQFTVYSGGQAEDNIITFAGSAFVFSGGTMDAATVSAAGFAAISSGGTADCLTVAAGGWAVAQSGAILSDVTIDSGGVLILADGPNATDIVNSGGYVFVVGSIATTIVGSAISTGVTQLSATAAGGWVETGSAAIVSGQLLSSSDDSTIVLSGGKLLDSQLTAGAAAAVDDGGIVQAVTVTADGVATIGLDGSSLSALIGSAGTEIIASGGFASQTRVVSGGTLLVEQDGQATETRVSGAVLVVDGAESRGTLTGHAVEFVFSGGEATSDTLSGGAEQIVFAHGMADATNLAFGGTEIVSHGGVAQSAFVSAGGQIFISGLADATSVVGGLAVVAPGGTATSLTVGDGGWAVISAGATVSSLSVDDGGMVLVIGGATVDGDVAVGGYVIEAQGASSPLSGPGAVLASGGAIVSATADGGLAMVSASLPAGGTLGAGEQALVLNSGLLDGSAAAGATVRVYAGGTTSGLTVSDAVEAVSSGGTAIGGRVINEGVLYVFSGAVATGITLAQQGLLVVDGAGSASSILVESGGRLVADADIINHSSQIMQTVDVLSDVTVAAGGSLDVDFGGVAQAVSVESAAEAFVFGTLSGAMLESGSYVIVESSYASLEPVLSAGGIIAGSLIKGAVLVEGGSAGFAAGLSNDTIAEGGVVLVQSGGTIDSSVTVSCGGTLILLNSATGSPSPTVRGGVLITSGAVVLSEPAAISTYFGSANGLSVSSGDTAYVLQGATLGAATIDNYGVLEVVAGGMVSDTVISAGGTLLAETGAILQGDITFAGIEGNLEFEYVPTGAVTVTGFGASDNLLFDTISGGSATYSLENGNTLVVSGEAGNVDQTTAVVLAGSVYTSAFVLSNTKTGGLEVSYEPATSGSFPDTDNTATYTIPLYVLNFGTSDKIGIELSLDGGTTYKMYEFDTGGTGLYAAYNPNWWSSYDTVSAAPSVIYYASGNTYTANVVSSTVTFQTSSGPVGVSADLGLIESADDPVKFTPQDWNGDTTDLTASAPLQNYFYGDFGVGLGSAENGIDNILSQFPSGASNGFIVTVGNEPESSAGGVGSLQVGLTADDIASYTTIIAMQGANGLETFAGSGETSYQELIAAGMLIVNSYLGSPPTSASSPQNTNFVFDTGAPSTQVHNGTTITSGTLDALPSATQVVLSAGSVMVGGKVTSGWILEENSGYPTGTDDVNGIGDTTGYVNTGINAYWGVSVMFDLADGVIGFKAIACFAESTCIRTPEGDRAVETLAVGELVTTIDGRAQPVQWIGHRAVDCRHHPDPASVLPVRIVAHAFGPYLPARDLLLSPDHALYLEGALIPVRYLINGDSIAQLNRSHVTYYHVELAVHDVIFAEGLPAETYLETGQRTAFANAGGIVQAHPCFAPAETDAQLLWAALGYAPLVISGPVVDCVRARLADNRPSRHPPRIAAG